MFSTVQQKFTSALSYFGYGSELSKGLPEKIYKTLENQDFITETPLHEHRITSKPLSIWKRVASLGMNYLVFSSGQSNLQQSPSDFTPWISAVSFTTLSELLAFPFIFVAGLSSFPGMTDAQSPDTTFFKVFGGAAADYGFALTVTSEGDIIVAGYTDNFGVGDYDVLLSKFSNNGTLVWANTLGGASFDRGYALTTTPEGDLIVAGYTNSAGNQDVLLSKFSSNGTLLWANSLGGATYDRGTDVTATSEGDLIVTGYTDSFGAGFDDMLLSKFSSNGTLLWANTLGGVNFDYGNALTTTPEGDLIVAGYTSSFGAGNQDVLLSKFSSNGTLLWANSLGGVGDDRRYALTTTPEGDLIIAGRTDSFGAGDYDVLLSKLLSNGTLLWANTFGGINDDYGEALTITPEGDLIVTGYTDSFGVGGLDALVAKFSSNGTLLWTNTLGGASDDYGNALMVTSEGDIIVTGYTDSFGVGNVDMLLAKFNAQGVIENCSAWQSVTPQVQSITPNITDVTLNMIVEIPPWTTQDAKSVLNVTDITSLMNQTTVCYEQNAISRTLTTSPQAAQSSQTPSKLSQDTRGGSGSILSFPSKTQNLSSTVRNFTQSNFSSPSSQSTSMHSSSSSTPTLPSRSPSLPSQSAQETTKIPEPSTGTTPSFTTFIYGESYSIIVNGQTIGSFYFTGGSGQLDSNNTNTLNIQLDGDIEDGETITLFTIPEGEESQWQDIILSYESESGCITTEGVFTTTSEDEHSYQLIFEYESGECSYAAAIKLAGIPVLSGGVL